MKYESGTVDHARLYTQFFLTRLIGSPGRDGVMIMACPACECRHAWFKLTRDGGFIYRCPRRSCDYNRATGYSPVYANLPNQRLVDLYLLLGGKAQDMDRYRFAPWWDSVVETHEQIHELMNKPNGG